MNKQDFLKLANQSREFWTVDDESAYYDAKAEFIEQNSKTVIDVAKRIDSGKGDVLDGDRENIAQIRAELAEHNQGKVGYRWMLNNVALHYFKGEQAE